MANRRYGNIGGGRNNFNNMQSQSVNPWQGGAAPGMNQNMGQTAFGQLNNPQALALALTSLLTGQQAQTQQHPPSLLNMPPINPGGYGGGGGGYGQGYQSGRGRDMYKNRNSRDLDRTNRQNQKKRQQHRDSFNRSRDLSKDKAKPEKSPSKSKDTKSDSGNKKAQETKKLPEDDFNKQDSLSEETEDKKRDWKEEKKDSETNEAKETNDKSSDKDNADKSVEDEDGKGDAKSDNDNEGSQYDGIPTELLACTYCNKKMWDAKSFEKHVNGRFHREMMEKLEDDHKIKSDILRRVLHFQEEKNQIEISRMRSLGKRVPPQNMLHCNMCDLNFSGHMSMHRRSEGHQKLKQFLHPKCKTCRKEFPHRMEWEHHMLSPEHLKRKAEITKEKGLKEDGISVDNDNDSELENELEPNDDNDDSIVDEKVITDYKEGQDLSDLENRLPTYSIGFVKYGKSFVKDVKGHYCRLCNVFFMSQEKSKSHMRTEKHYKAFTEFLKKKSEKEKARAAKQEEEKRKGKEDGEKKRKTEEDDEKKTKPEKDDEKKRKGDDKDMDDEGNWKRRKQATDDEETVDGDDSKDDSNTKDGNAPYDPLEVDEDEEDSEKKDSVKKLIDSIDDKVGDLTDEMWQEVDKDIGGILESVAIDNPKEKSDGDDGAPPEVTEKEEKKQPVTRSYKPGPKSKRGKI